ncbi:beta-1,6-N-acetylglucosaminyltransferase [Clavibacter tessellarius]|uniref:beta-1,6-N-acetylglucosaminyltransferase n=1 Tax=Clavibacter tessellarius TaxID=31965 RepID=UPI003244280A
MSVFLIYTFREPELLARTIRRLAPHPVVVHVDRKVDQAPFVAALAAEDRDRVEFLADRVRVNWGGYSQVEAIRRLVAAGIARARPEEHLVLLSGQDYPIRPVAELEAMLAGSGGKQFLRYFDVAGSEEKYTAQVDRRYHRDLALLSARTTDPRLRRARNAAIRVLESASRAAGPLRPPAGFRVAHGVTHFAMTAGFAAEARGVGDARDRALLPSGLRRGGEVLPVPGPQLRARTGDGRSARGRLRALRGPGQLALRQPPPHRPVAHQGLHGGGLARGGGVARVVPAQARDRAERRAPRPDRPRASCTRSNSSARRAGRTASAGRPHGPASHTVPRGRRRPEHGARILLRGSRADGT